MGERNAARLDLETRLDPRDWRLAHTPDQVTAVLRRVDLIVTVRMHALVLGLTVGIPVLAIDPIAGGGKVSSQAQAWSWPAVLQPEDLNVDAFDRWWHWCLGEAGRAPAATASDELPDHSQLEALVASAHRPTRSEQGGGPGLVGD